MKTPGDTVPDWSSIEEGLALSPFVRATGLANWNRYAAVNDEFIDIHMDGDAARAIGQPDAFGMGNLRFGYLHALLQRWLTGRGEVIELACQYRGINQRGDVLTVHGRVTGKEPGGLVHLALGVRNQRGEETTPSTATVRLSVSPAPPDPEPQTEEVTVPERGKWLDENVRSWIGRALPPAVSYPIGANDIRRWAQAIHYPEPAPREFVEPSLVSPLVAPLDFNPFAWQVAASDLPPWMAPLGQAPGQRALNGGQRARYYAPMRAGDVITSVDRLVQASEREGSLGTMLFLVTESRWINQRGELIRISRDTGIRY